MNELNFPRQAGASPSDAKAAGWADLRAPEERPTVFPLLTHYLGVVRRRRWLIFGAVVAAIAVSLILTLMMTPLYTSSSTVEIQREDLNITRVEGVDRESSPVDMEFYQTQYGLLRSRALAERVATDLRLYDDAGFFEMFGIEKGVEWFENGRLRPAASTREQRVEAVATTLLRNITVSPVRLSRLVDVGFTSPDPNFSSRIVNAWTRHFIDTELDRRYQRTSYARHFLERRLQQAQGRLNESERVLVGYAARENIINIPGAEPQPGQPGGSSDRPIIAEDLAAFNRELAVATAERLRAQSRLGTPGGSTSEALDNQAITGLRQRRAELAGEYSRLMTQFEPEYPAALAIQRQIQQLDQSISREEARVRSSLRANYDASTQREASLNQRVDTLKSNLLDLRRRSIQYNIFQRDVDSNREIYQALLQRYKEIGVAGGVGVNNISVVDIARAPDRPSSPRLILNLLVALVAGVGAGLGLALALEQIDDAISDPSDLESAFGLPLLGTIPKSKEEDTQLALGDRKSEVSEAYMAVQTSLSFSTDHGVPKSLTITSTRPGEGKSTTAFAIAQSLARTGRKVLLVDGDLRAPSIHHLVGLPNDKGLSNFLAGDDNLGPLVHNGNLREIAIMPAGPQPPSAAELLAGDRLELLMQLLLARFDHVVLDGPPVMGLADAPLLASKTEATVFVVESHSTKIGQARLAIGRLAAAQAHLIGAVLTKFETKRAAYGYGYGYEYGYGYGRTEEAKN
jgi:polysaccharide biosynthesis transport protein